MEEESSYGIVSYRELSGLKKEIEELKTKNTGDTSKPLLESISKLTQNMDSMLGLFKSAADELKLEESGQINIIKEISPLSEKLDQILQQTKTIAESMVTIAEMVRDLKDLKESKPMPPKMPPPQAMANIQPPIGQEGPQMMAFPPPPNNMNLRNNNNSMNNYNMSIPPPMPGGFQQQMRQPPPMPQQQMNFQAPFEMPPEMQGDIPLEPFPPMPEPKKKGLFGRFKK